MNTSDQKKTFTTAEATEAFLQQQKAKHGKVHVWKTTDGKYTAYFRPADRITVDASMAIIRSHPVQSDEIIAKDCFIGGDMEVITENKYFFGLRNFLGRLIEVAEGEFTEL